MRSFAILFNSRVLYCLRQRLLNTHHRALDTRNLDEHAIALGVCVQLRVLGHRRARVRMSDHLKVAIGRQSMKTCLQPAISRRPFSYTRVKPFEAPDCVNNHPNMSIQCAKMAGQAISMVYTGRKRSLSLRLAFRTISVRPLDLDASSDCTTITVSEFFVVYHTGRLSLNA